MHYLLFYEFAPDYLKRRPQFRTEHLKHAWAASETGELVLAGAYADPADGGLLVFECDGPDTPQAFAAHDPYVKNGLVQRYWVRGWTTVVGKDAAMPVQPERAM
jgi:uncharacterized protein YciI